LIDLLLYFFLGLLIISFELGRKRYFIIDHITLFNFFFFLVYSFTPIALILEGTHLINDDMPYGSEYFGNFEFTPIIVFGAYLFFLGGYIFTINQNAKYSIDFKTKFEIDLVVKVLPFLYLILFTFFYIYVSEFGGLMEAIEQAEAYRSGAITYHKFGFLQRFFSLNTILFYYLYFKVILQKEQKYRWIFITLFIVSIILSIMIMAVYSSRGFIIFELTGLYIITAMYYKNYFLKYLIPSLTVAFLIIKFGRPFMGSISDLVLYGFDAFWSGFTSRLDVIEQESQSIVSNFTHPIVSLEVSLQRSGVDVDLRYFMDIFYAFFSLLPNELLGIKDPQKLMELNSLLLQGQEVEEILPGVLGFFSYSLSIVGVLLGSFVYGVVGGILYKLFITFYKQYKSSLIYIYIISLSYGYFVFRGSPGNLLQEKFILLVVLFVIFFNSKIIIKKI